MGRRYNENIRKLLLVLIASIALVTVGVLSGKSRVSLSPLPSTMLWVWDHPEDLSSLDCRRAGVAALGETITLTADLIRLEPRHQPLSVPEGCATVSVVRINAAEGATPPQRIEPISRELLRIADQGGIRGLQTDFEALDSQRQFYRSLLHRVRDDLPDGVTLSIAAAPSWCSSDHWIDDLPIDEAVPVLFERDGEDARPSADLKGGARLTSRKCQQSLAVSAEDPPLNLPVGRRLFVTQSQPWSAERIAGALAWAGQR